MVVNDSLGNFNKALEGMRSVNKTLPPKLLINDPDKLTQFKKFYKAICKA